MSRQDLFDCMVNRHGVILYSMGKSYSGFINGIKVEDGSGYSFIVTMNTKVDGTYKNVDLYYRCKS